MDAACVCVCGKEKKKSHFFFFFFWILMKAPAAQVLLMMVLHVEVLSSLKCLLLSTQTEFLLEEVWGRTAKMPAGG
ncbi:hypothetical protein [Dankookia sp. P2]|uniref:hypothetical protein n=1 Tax=Dankookia sp. P2 TaxID=3423955 RepID=UPI003D67F4AF